MKLFFEDKLLEEWYETGIAPKKGRYKKYWRDAKFCRAYFETIKLLSGLSNISKARAFSSLHYEQLKENYSGKSSVRIMNGRKERLIFIELDDGLKIEIIELENSHYGNE